MQKTHILITGASGEVGQSLLPKIQKEKPDSIVSLDIKPLPQKINFVENTYTGSTTQKDLVKKIFKKHEINLVVHLAARLSTFSERNPEESFRTNIIGTRNLLEMSHISKQKVLFFLPSSIAVYNVPDKKTKADTVVSEDMFTNPSTLYGIQKIYAELLGTYYDKFNNIDFRSIRFPGLISMETLPSGGTSDFGPEIVHHFAKGKDYSCYVRRDSRIPFMAMSDATDAIIKLLKTDKKRLKKTVYNINAFSACPDDFIKEASKFYKKVKVDFKIDKRRQEIVDSWPALLDDSLARRHWGWKEKYNFKEVFEKILIK